MQDVQESGLKPLNRRQQAKAKTRQKVLDAGRDLFKKGGYGQATIRDIAKAADMSTGAVFANFDSKTDLLLAIAKEEFESHKELLKHAASDEGAVLDCIMRVCTTDFVFFADRLHLMEALAGIETLIEPEADDPRATSRRARAITEQRREQIRMHIWLQLDAARCGTIMFNAVLSTIMVSAHIDRCRQGALRMSSAEEYWNSLKEDFSFLISRRAMNLAA